MSTRLYELGLRQIAGGLASLYAPTPETILQLANDLRRMEVNALQIDDARLAVAAKDAEATARFLPTGTAEDPVACARALHRVGSILLLRLFEGAAKPKDFVASHPAVDR